MKAMLLKLQQKSLDIIGFLQKLTKVKQRIKNLNQKYSFYKKKLKKLRWIKIIPVKVDIGEIPLYVEILVRDGKIRLCDFGWAYEYNTENPKEWNHLGNKQEADIVCFNDSVNQVLNSC